MPAIPPIPAQTFFCAICSGPLQVLRSEVDRVQPNKWEIYCPNETCAQYKNVFNMTTLQETRKL